MEKYEINYLHCLELRGVSPRTKVDYLRRLHQLVQYYDVSPDTLTIEQIRNYFIYLIHVKQVSNKTAKMHYYSLRFYYHHLLGWDLSLFTFYKPRVIHKLPVVLTREEVNRIFSHIRNEEYRLIIEFLYQCGLRVSEVVRIAIADLNGDPFSVTIRNGKGGKDRVVPIPERLYHRLREYWKTHRNRLILFPGHHRKDRNNNPRHIPARTIQLAMKKR